jgi:hypothetical protein
MDPKVLMMRCRGRSERRRRNGRRTDRDLQRLNYLPLRMRGFYGLASGGIGFAMAAQSVSALLCRSSRRCHRRRRQRDMYSIQALTGGRTSQAANHT